MYQSSWTICAVLLITTGAVHAESQLERNVTASDAAHRADKELDKVYLTLLRKGDARSTPQLERGRERWLEYRLKASALEEAEYEGGSIAPEMYWRCYERLTRERTARLMILLKTYR